MPYLKDDDRLRFAEIKQVFNNLLEESEPLVAGELNYLFTTFIVAHLKKKGQNYANINEVVGALECIKQEFYRRYVIPYEDKKMTENGDAY
jgi:hypothetical protein